MSSEQNNDPKAISLIQYLLYLKPFLDDSANTEIIINKPGEVVTESSNGWQYFDVPELNYNVCSQIAKLTATYTKQKLDASKPILSGSLPGGERIQIVIPTATIQDTVSMTIRKPSTLNFTLEDYEKQGFFDSCAEFSEELNDDEKDLIKFKEEGNYVDFLKLAVQSHKNIIISGSTGSGKTTFFRSLLDLVPQNERLISIENVDELGLYETHPNTVSLFYSAGGQGVSEITQQDLLESCLRMKPDRIFLAELIRGDEAFYFLRNVNSGHPGSITTMHANTAKLAFEQLVLFIKESKSGGNMSFEDIKKLLYMCVDVIVQINNVKGKRMVTEIYYDPVFKRKQMS